MVPAMSQLKRQFQKFFSFNFSSLNPLWVDEKQFYESLDFAKVFEWNCLSQTKKNTTIRAIFSLKWFEYTHNICLLGGCIVSWLFSYKTRPKKTVTE